MKGEHFMKEFVLGMESLLISNATEQFGSDNIVVIPMATIEELESFEGYPEETPDHHDLCHARSGGSICPVRPYHGAE